MGKKILLLLASVFLIWQSYKLLMRIDEVNTNSWIALLFAGWIINLYITGIFAFSGFALPTQKLLPQSYYKINNPTRLKKIYKFFGVDTFRKFLLATFWKNKKQRKKYFNGRADGIRNLELQSMKSEFGHLIPFILISILSIYFVTTGFLKLGIVSFVINWIGNWYPIILQRHHRMRIERLLKR